MFIPTHAPTIMDRPEPSTDPPQPSTDVSSDDTSRQEQVQQANVSLWDGFLATLRDAVAPDSTTEATDVPASASESSDQRVPHEPSGEAETTRDMSHSSSVLFRLPFDEADGSPAMLRFYPTHLPHAPSNGQRSGPPPTTLPEGTTAVAHDPNAHRNHPDGHVPITPLFVPSGASPLPFAFIYDAATHTAWPIMQITPETPPGGPAPDTDASQQSHRIAGPAFQVHLNVNFGSPPEPEKAEPERAAKYVAGLEQADAELRSRMARIGLGSIGGYGEDEEDALLGCGICLDQYEEEDRPEWLDGEKSHETAVIAVPCTGHHTLHAGCLRDWLANLPPSQWTCPFCRAALTSQGKRNGKNAVVPVYSLQTLRDLVRQRERDKGWRCDAPACLARYPASTNKKGHVELTETSDQTTTRLITLKPCKHAVHIDCLCTSARVEHFVNLQDSEPTEGADSAGVDPSDGEEDKDTVGKWVNCPTCRKEVWAELPLSRKPVTSLKHQLDSSADATAVEANP